MYDQNKTFLLSLTAPGAHILRLYKDREEAARAETEVRGTLASLQEQHQVDLETALTNLRQELQNKASDYAEMERTQSTCSFNFTKGLSHEVGKW